MLHLQILKTEQATIAQQHEEEINERVIFILFYINFYFAEWEAKIQSFDASNFSKEQMAFEALRKKDVILILSLFAFVRY